MDAPYHANLAPAAASLRLELEVRLQRETQRTEEDQAVAAGERPSRQRRRWGMALRVAASGEGFRAVVREVA
jgi:hypothetical protein